MQNLIFVGKDNQSLLSSDGMKHSVPIHNKINFYYSNMCITIVTCFFTSFSRLTGQCSQLLRIHTLSVMFCLGLLSVQTTITHFLYLQYDSNL